MPTFWACSMAVEGPINQTTGGIFYFEMESCLVWRLQVNEARHVSVAMQHREEREGETL